MKDENGKIRRMHISELKRQQIIEAHLAKADTATIAALVGCHPTTVRGIIRRASEPKPTPAKFISQAKTAEDVAASTAEPTPTLVPWSDFARLCERVAILETKLGPLLS